jgi:hypothetical protein
MPYLRMKLFKSNNDQNEEWMLNTTPREIYFAYDNSWNPCLNIIHYVYLKHLL